MTSDTCRHTHTPEPDIPLVFVHALCGLRPSLLLEDQGGQGRRHVRRHHGHGMVGTWWSNDKADHYLPTMFGMQKACGCWMLKHLHLGLGTHFFARKLFAFALFGLSGIGGHGIVDGLGDVEVLLGFPRIKSHVLLQNHQWCPSP